MSDIPAILGRDPETGGIYLIRPAANFIYPPDTLRKLRHNLSKQKHDVMESSHPITAAKLMKRRKLGLCLGCGKSSCKCKSKDKQ